MSCYAVAQLRVQLANDAQALIDRPDDWAKLAQALNAVFDVTDFSVSPGRYSPVLYVTSQHANAGFTVGVTTISTVGLERAVVDLIKAAVSEVARQATHDQLISQLAAAATLLYSEQVDGNTVLYLEV